MASESAGGPSSPQRLNSTTFSFKAPFPATTKQRRVSLALPSSPRLVPAWDFRDDTGLGSHVPECLMPEKRGKMRKIAPEGDDEKRPRKKWSEEETKMLVDGCQLHGVGNWKTILNDPNLRFDNRSPVDLKDRFRTYFPDAYKKHYPNAKTHLSSKVRSTLPDGSSLFEKARSKKRRPFTEEEDRALKAGYEKHGTLWATIAKDPVFQDQNRRSTDLRDRFRNAFPELYEAAGYKPRNKKMGGPVRSATDDTQVGMSSGPRRKRRNTSQGLLRGGTKSVPQSTAPSEDEDSSGEEDNPPSMSAPVQSPAIADDDEMDLGPMDPLSTSLSMADFDAHSQTWSSGLDTPTHSSIHAWSTNSPTSSHLSGEYLMNSPFQRRGDSLNGMIGKSAWGTNDWFSANPRLDNSGSSSLMDDNFSPSSPFSFHNLNHGVFDRYDLVPASMPHDFSSEVGIGETHSTFSDELFQPSGFRGFTHHSNYAGDLIFGARTQNPGGSSFGGFGLGLSQLGPGLPQSTGIHPMQLHTPALPGIDEIGLTGITLDDNAEIVPDPDVEVSLDDLVHSTPPGTPLTQPTIPSLRLRKRSVTFGNQFSVRSVSVPPTRPAQVQQTNSQPEIPTAARDSSRRPSDPTRRAGRPDSSRRPDPRSQPPPSSYPSHFPVTDPHHYLAPSSNFLTPSISSSALPPNDFYDLPFLDLHYYYSGQEQPEHRQEQAEYRQEQALDLAGGSSLGGRAPLTVQKALGEMSMQKAIGEMGLRKAALTAEMGMQTDMDMQSNMVIRSNMVMQTTEMGMQAGGILFAPTKPAPKRGTVVQSRTMSHQRGQSAVCPPLSRSDNNKRKRASWDGAHT